MTNQEVIRAWREGRYAQAGSLRSDGDDLFSYGLKIGGRDVDGSLYVIDYTAEGGYFVSTTTSRHVNYAKRLGVKVYGGSGTAYPQAVGQTPAPSDGFRFFRPEVPDGQGA